MLSALGNLQQSRFRTGLPLPIETMAKRFNNICAMIESTNY